MFLVVAVLFFLSGASALMYQVIWLRMLSLVFGVTAYQSVFPETTVWVDGTLLAGSTRPLRVDRDAVARRFQDPDLRAALTGAGFADVPAVLAAYTAGPNELRAFLGEGPVLTDDKPKIDPSTGSGSPRA
jgi:hypothetical protein